MSEGPAMSRDVNGADLNAEILPGDKKLWLCRGHQSEWTGQSGTRGQNQGRHSVAWEAGRAAEELQPPAVDSAVPPRHRRQRRMPSR